MYLDRVVKGEESPIDMVITDYYLENTLTGADLLDTVRRHYHITREALPVIVMTSKDDAALKVELLHMGANDLLNKPLQEEIMMARIRTLLHLKQQYDALQSQNRAIERVAQSDALTGVYNRRYLTERGREWLKNDKTRPLWALIVDVDNLSRINGREGLLVGDHILASIGNLLNEHFGNCLVARFGGEEFAVLLPHTPWQNAVTSIESLRKKVEFLSPDGIDVTVSIGVAGIQDDAKSNLNTLISMADKALAEAKTRGRNRICYTDNSQQVHDLDAALATA